ncbi:hypothetical protein Efla_001770 [Eimeria flavescens]
MSKPNRRKAGRQRDAEYDSSDGSVGPGGGTAAAAAAAAGGRRWKRREAADLSLIVVQEEVEASRVGAASWATAHAGPSAQLSRCLCCCCGMPGRFRCSECCRKRSSSSSSSSSSGAMAAAAAAGAAGWRASSAIAVKYLCSAECLSVHRAADCTPRHLLNWLG